MRQGNEINYILIGLAIFVLYEIFKAKPALPANVPGLIAVSDTPPPTTTGSVIPPQPAGPCPANSQWIFNGAYWTCALVSQTTQTPNQTLSWWDTIWGWIPPLD